MNESCGRSSWSPPQDFTSASFAHPVVGTGQCSGDSLLGDFYLPVFGRGRLDHRPPPRLLELHEQALWPY